MALENAKRERFAHEYVVDRNGTQAAIRAGYSAKTAHVQACRLLNDAKVSARIAELSKAIEKRAAVSADWVVSELAKIARADPRKFFKPDGSLIPVHELDDDCAAALSAMEVVALGDTHMSIHKIKRWDRVRVLELIGKHIGMWPNKIEANVNFVDGLTTDEQRTLAAALRAVARDKGEDTGGDRPAHRKG